MSGVGNLGRGGAWIATNRWMLVPIALLGFTVTVATVTVMSAVVGHPLGAEPAYDRKAASFDSERAQRLENERLRWVVTPEVSSHGARHSVAIRVEDKHAARIDATRVTVECIPVVDAGARLEVELARSGPGEFSGGFESAVGGQWEFRVAVEDDGVRYTDAFRRFLSPVRGGGGHG
jgi:hypothetical protein